MRLVLLALTASTAFTWLPAQEHPAEHVVETMGPLLERIPDYACLETVTRRLSNSDPDQPRESEDRLRVEVALVEGRERYSWPGSDSFEATSLAELAGYGVSSSGEFGPHARGIFLSDQSLIRLSDRSVNGGETLLRFEYEVPEMASTYWLESAGRRTKVGCSGMFLADRETGEVVRLEIQASDPSGASGFLSTSAAIDLVRASVGDVETLLPRRAVVKAHTTDGVESENTHDYSECRVFRAGSTISFDAPAKPRANALGAAKSVVAPGLELRIESTELLSSEDVAAGDSFGAVLTRNMYNGAELIALKGAPVKARIGQVEWLLFPSSRAVIALELTEMEVVGGAVANIHATLERIDRASPMQRLMTSKTSPPRPAKFSSHGTLI